jgi:hypothetical protein
VNLVKGKKNKLRIGDKVEMTQEQIKFYCENINDLFLASTQTELEATDYASVAGFYHAILTGIMPKGKVLGFGATDSGPESKGSHKWVDLKDQKTVRVTFKLKYGTYSAYFSERYLRKI